MPTEYVEKKICLSTTRLIDSAQDGKPYIVSNAARKVLNTSSPLSEGYTIMSQSIFKDHSDHDFYDRDCTAHKKLKVCDLLDPFFH